MNILVIIPARGGSKGIPRKNVRLMGGRPLISYVIEKTKKSKYQPDIWVSTDDDEIAKISNKYKALVHKRPAHLADELTTLDPVIYQAKNSIEEKLEKKYDYVITVQPTSPLLTTETLDKAIEFCIDEKFDTVISATNNPHLSWGKKADKFIPNYEKRLNRQELPKHFIETGAFVITKGTFLTKNSRFGPKVSIFEVPKKESIDIDTAQDWWVAEKELTKKNIVIRVEGYSEIGLGHVYRCLQLAYNLIDHNVLFIISEKSSLGIKKLADSHFDYRIIKNTEEMRHIIEDFDCDILINDILNTDQEYMKFCKARGVRLINFEDLGEGASIADVVINDLYDKQNDLNNAYWGSDYYIIRDEFLISEPYEFKSKVENVLVIFGGTDPHDLTKKVFDTVIENDDLSQINFTFIIGLGYKHKETLISRSEKHSNIQIVSDVRNMTEYMIEADIAFSSQGRTMLELGSMQVPTILLAQNRRELTHAFGYMENGFLNLGLGDELKKDTILQTLKWLINSPEIRKQMYELVGRKNLKDGLTNVKKLIFNEEV